ncbi:MAG: cytochrome c3 family protein [Pirellulaceae bacterium]|nr:cytochrome c3 family protein [Pirellulaceae bacterium]
MDRFYFPLWVNRFVPLLIAMKLGGLLYLGSMFYVGAAGETMNVGFRPEQSIPFSHRTHAGELQLDCRYCHTTVEKGARAAIPPTQVCANCHDAGETFLSQPETVSVHFGSERLKPLYESQIDGKPVFWKKVHDLPDYVFFDHSAHVTRGVSCVSCHGRVDQMDVVERVETLTMGWCLECHRNPDAHIRPQEFITDLGWTPEGDAAELGKKLRTENNIQPSTSCSTCHR